MFEDKLGMGEDAILGYGLAKQGKLIYQPDILFFHNDAQQSHYSIQLKQYACRVMYSRLYLSYEKARLDHSSPGMARLHFIWYGFWRIGGYLVSRCVKRTEASRQMLSGSLQGYKRALRSNFEYSQARNAFWQVEAKKTNKFEYNHKYSISDCRKEGPFSNHSALAEYVRLFCGIPMPGCYGKFCHLLYLLVHRI
ncbi:MAG: hypothetical protein HWD58_14170 [Bacteroidota bacterium]|nr:MAG: hypothetical protein HWD58_14170 [Bacteroidota bacterium]